MDAERRRLATAGVVAALGLAAGGAASAGARSPVVRISRGTFAPDRFAEVERLIRESLAVLEPGLRAMRGLLHYYAAVDAATGTVVNVSIWVDVDAARQMDTFAEMLAQRPVLEQAGVTFAKIANYEPLWVLGAAEHPPAGAGA